MRKPILALATLLGLLPAISQGSEPEPSAPAAIAPATTNPLPDSGFVSEGGAAEDFRKPAKPLGSNAFTVHPGFSILISGLNISYEAALGRGLWNYEIPFYIGYNERLWNNPTLFVGSGFGLRRYLLERGAGTYVAPCLDILNVKRWDKGPDVGNNVVIVVPNLRMGHRWTWNVFTMDLSVGFAYYDAIATDGVLGDQDPDRRGLLPMVQYSLGVPF